MNFIISLLETTNVHKRILDFVWKFSHIVQIMRINANMITPEVAVKFDENFNQSYVASSKKISDYDNFLSANSVEHCSTYWRQNLNVQVFIPARMAKKSNESSKKWHDL